MENQKCSAKLMREIAGLADLPRDVLVERWTGFFGSDPPRRLTKDLLVRGVAYEIQAEALGGLSIANKKELIALAAGQRRANLPKAKAGVRLYRSWRGIAHEVLVLESGYSWRGNNYASLSEVARAITGTRWSGPRFFGVAA